MNHQFLLLMIQNVFCFLYAYGITNDYNDPQDRVLSQMSSTKYIINLEHFPFLIRLSSHIQHQINMLQYPQRSI